MSDADAGPADCTLTTPDVQDLCEEAVAAAHARAYAIIDQAASRSSIDRELLLRSYHYAFDKHSAHRRKSGELYITHPIEVVGILMQLEVDTATMAAGFLHDVIEDCEITKADLAEAFSAEIATLVDGVSKLKLADFERLAPDLAAAAKEKDASKHPAVGAPKKRPHEARSSAENLRKILLAMARDLRVMVIKLADRLHNLKTISGLAPDRQQRMAEETLSVYAPLAARLGIWDLKWQLEDLAFKTLQPLDYKHLTEQIARTRRDREADIAESISTLRTAFDQGTLDVEINGRPKHLWSIYKKMNEQEIPLSDIYDLIALRVIVDSVPDCYAALGIVHETYLPIPGKFDDYIAKRKSNGYQSLHTKVYGPRGEPLEVQIRTWEMHKTSEFGIAAHWAYKEKGDGAVAGNNDFERKMAFLRKQLFEWQRDARDTSEFLSQVSTDLFTSQVFVFTPRGDVIDLPTGATPIDFAYRIHTGIGEHLAIARVNGKTVPLSYQFDNGDICEVISRPNATPSLDWLGVAKSTHAKNKIRHYFRVQRHDISVVRGREALTDELHRLNLSTEVIKDTKRLLVFAQAFNKESGEDLFAAIGFGDTPLGAVIHRIRREFEESPDPTLRLPKRVSGQTSKLSITTDKVDGVAIVRAKCCLPLPGDTVIGYVTRGRGMVLHRDGCINIAGFRLQEPERLQEVDWTAGGRYATGVIIETLDRTGLLRDVTDVLAGTDTFITGINTYSHRDKGTATLRIDLDSPSLSHLETLIRKLQTIPDLLAVYRLGVGADEIEPPSRLAHQ